MTNAASLLQKLKELNIPYFEEQPMTEYTTMQIGGPASVVARVRSAEELILAVKAAKELGVRFTVIGNGSNVIFADRGFDGLVIVTSDMKQYTIEGNLIKADCGVSVTRLSVEAQKAGLAGLSFAYGIPGTLGGGVYMNAGAYGGSLSDVVISSICFDTEHDTIRKIDFEEHEFSYRHSIYTKNPNLVILAAMLELKPGDKDEIAEQMSGFIKSRKEKQPLDLPSAGSVFKRPLGYYAGELIENCGLKGYRIGGAEVSEKHAGFIVNRGHATADDVRRLVVHIQNTVKREYAVNLECEIKYID